jgi:hypothetical protein
LRAFQPKYVDDRDKPGHDSGSSHGLSRAMTTNRNARYFFLLKYRVSGGG